FVNGTLTITKATPVVTWAAPAAITYGTALDVTQLNASSGVAGTFVYTPASGTVLAAGAQTLSVTFTPTDGADYNPVTTTVALTVNPAPLTITTVNVSKIYGAALPGFTVTYATFVTGDSSVSLAGTLVFTTTATATSPVGAYTVTPSGVSSGNYAITFVNGTLTISKAPLTVTADNKSKLQGAANPPLTHVIGGLVNGDSEATALTTPVAIITTATAASAAGTYPITVSAADGPNYAVTFVAGTLTVVMPAPVPAISGIAPTTGSTLGGDSVTITGTDFTGASVTVGGLSTTITAINATTITISTPAHATGSVDVVVTTPNGSDTATNGFAYTTSDPVITWGAPAGITYGTPLSATQLSATASVAGTFVYTPAAGTVLGAGVGQILSATFTPTNTADYNTVTTTVAITVTTAPLTVTTVNVSKVFGAALPSFTVTYVGFVNGNTSASLAGALAFATTATAASPVGTYAVTPSGVSSGNYAITFVAGTLTISQAAAVISWAAPAAITYGTALSATQLNATANTAGTFVYAPAAGTVLAAGAGQALNVTFTPSNANFAGATASVALTVAPAALTITAIDQTKVHDSANPTLTAVYAGFVNGDTAASLTTPLTLATTAVAASPVGTYPIIASGATSANYAITFVSGTLTVVPAAGTLDITTIDLVGTVTGTNVTLSVGGAPVPVVNGTWQATVVTPGAATQTTSIDVSAPGFAPVSVPLTIDEIPMPSGAG
nr:IPT/TIG domain-containing protein [Planctomycetota bacterium]